MKVVLVTGTDTGVGKSVATAALACNSLRAGRRVSVVKPVQSGVTPNDPSDVDTIQRLSGVTGIELVRLDDALAPDSAARLRGLEIPRVEELAARIAVLAADSDVTYVEGAGGVLVRLDQQAGTLLTLGRHLSAGKANSAVDLVVVIVTRVRLGTLNHTELTVRAVQSAGLDPAGLVLGDVPEHLGLAERVNHDELPRVTGVPIIGALPHGVGGWSGPRFQRECASWFSETF